VSDLQEKLQLAILDRLRGRKKPTLTKSEFEKAKQVFKKTLKAQGTAIDEAMESLIREQHVTRSLRGTYLLEPKGRVYLAQLESDSSPLPPGVDEDLVPFQKAFVLMQLFCAKESSLTRSKLIGKLKQKQAK
jgi:hypothetical protein